VSLVNIIKDIALNIQSIVQSDLCQYNKKIGSNIQFTVQSDLLAKKRKGKSGGTRKHYEL